MPPTKKALLSWSSGKDSAWSLHLLNQDPSVEVVALLVNVIEEEQRLAAHGVRPEVVEAQAASIGLPIWWARLPQQPANGRYEEVMAGHAARALSEGITAIAYGDLFLQEIRDYREGHCRRDGIEAIFPLWGRDTAQLAREMQAGGLRARICCLDPDCLPAEFAGRDWDAALLAGLPLGIDPCGENGEFHTVTYDGPIYRTPLALIEADTTLVAAEKGAPHSSSRFTDFTLA